MKSNFTPLHLTILISAHVGNNEGYPPSSVAREYEADLVREGLIYRTPLEFNNAWQSTVFGKAKLAELLLIMHCKGTEK